MPHEVKIVANDFLDLARRDGEILDPMKIQKLVYLAHGWHLALHGPALIKQQVEAWPYGPVIRTCMMNSRNIGLHLSLRMRVFRKMPRL
jgi:uncharacterized phage-associated protein